MAQHVKGPCHKLYNLSLIPGTQMVEENFHELSSNFHIYIHNLHIQINKTNFFKDPINEITSNPSTWSEWGWGRVQGHITKSSKKLHEILSQKKKKKKVKTETEQSWAVKNLAALDNMGSVPQQTWGFIAASNSRKLITFLVSTGNTRIWCT